MTLNRRPLRLVAALDERDSAKVTLYFLKRNGGSAADIMAAVKRFADLQLEVELIREQLHLDKSRRPKLAEGEERLTQPKFGRG